MIITDKSISFSEINFDFLKIIELPSTPPIIQKVPIVERIPLSDEFTLSGLSLITPLLPTLKPAEIHQRWPTYARSPVLHLGNLIKIQTNLQRRNLKLMKQIF